jgi:lysozyme
VVGQPWDEDGAGVSHFGVDISNWQGDVNIEQMVNQLRAMGGVTPFVIVKATESVNYVNPLFASQIKAAQAAGADVAAYLFDEGRTSSSGEQLYFRHVAGGIPEAFDMEDPQGDTPQQYIAKLNQLNCLNSQALDYLNYSEAKQGMGGEGLWLAYYSGTPGLFPAGIQHPIIHQYTSTGRLNGASGGLDLDIWLGTEAQYQNFFHPGTSAPLPTPTQEQPTVPDFNPPLVTAPLVSELDWPHGGVQLLAEDGGVFCFGGAPFLGSAVGKPYFAGRTAERLVYRPAGQPNPSYPSEGYTIIDKTGSSYNF